MNSWQFDWAVWAVLFGVFGIFSLGFDAGQRYIIRQDKRRNVVRSDHSSDVWWIVSTITVVFAIAMAAVAVNPPEKLKERADKIRSSVTAVDPVR